jgi:cation transport regulator ChaB
MTPRVEPIRAVFPDRRERPKDDRERPKHEQDTFTKALQDAQEQEDGRQDRSGT